MKLLYWISLKSSAFWNMKPPSPFKFCRRFEGICRLLFQSRRMKKARNRLETGQEADSVCYLLYAAFLPCLFLDIKCEGNMFFPNVPERQLTFDALHGVISHKAELFTTIPGRTLNPTLVCHSIGFVLVTALVTNVSKTDRICLQLFLNSHFIRLVNIKWGTR
jgi:hypothetical protein